MFTSNGYNKRKLKKYSHNRNDTCQPLVLGNGRKWHLLLCLRAAGK